MAAETGQHKWTEMFRRSRVCGGVFNVTDYGEGGVYGILGDAGLPTETSGMMFSHYHSSTPILDGWVIHFSPYGFPAGALSAGTRLVGYRPFRLLCHMLDLTPPRRLKGEPEIPPVEELVEDFAQQQSLPKEELHAQARMALGISDSWGLKALVYRQWGDSVVPLDDDIKRAVRPKNEWGEAGLTMWEQEQYETRGISLEDAQAWKAMSATPMYRVDELLPFGLEEVQRWVAAGVDTGNASGYLRGSYLPRPVALSEVEAFLAAGLRWRGIDGMVRAGYGPEMVEEYRKVGVKGDDVGYFAEIGASPSDVEELFSNGLRDGQMAWRLHGKGWTLDDLKHRSVSDRAEALRS